MTNRFKLSVKNYSEKWSNFCHLDLWFRRYECLYFWLRHQFDVMLANSLNQGVRYPELHFSVYYVFWLSVKGGFY